MKQFQDITPNVSVTEIPFCRISVSFTLADHAKGIIQVVKMPVAKCFWHFTELSPEYLGVRDDRGKFLVELI